LGHEEIVEMLLERATQIDPPDPKGSAAVHWLCQSKSPRIARMVLEKGIDVARVDDDQRVGPYYLIDTVPEADAIQILELLVQNGWDVNQPSGPNRSTLLGACLGAITKPVEVMRWLIRHGANLAAPAPSENRRIIDVIKTKRNLRTLAAQLSEPIAEWEKAHQKT
jgi:hypothetical protein